MIIGEFIFRKPGIRKTRLVARGPETLTISLGFYMIIYLNRKARDEMHEILDHHYDQARRIT